MVVDESAMAVDAAVDVAVKQPVDGAMADKGPTKDPIILLRELLSSWERGQCLAGCGRLASGTEQDFSNELQGFVDKLKAIDERAVSSSFCCGSCIMWSFGVAGWRNRPAELCHGPRCRGGPSKPDAGELVAV